MSTLTSRLGVLIGALLLGLAFTASSATAAPGARQTGTCTNGVKWTVTLDAQYLSLSMSGRKLTPNTLYTVTATAGGFRVTAQDNSEGRGTVSASEHTRHDGALTSLAGLKVTCTP